MNWANARNIAETIALLLAGAFFIYKFISGYLIVNLSVKLKCIRHALESSDEDLLAINVTLAKGDRGSLDFHDASVQVKYDGSAEEIQLHGFERSSYTGRTDVTDNFKKVNWSSRSQKSPFLRLTPGEETQLAAKCLVPRDKECLVEAVILGKRTKGWKIGQWKAACVSLPGSKS
jgi:hypothetical protein